MKKIICRVIFPILVTVSFHSVANASMRCPKGIVSGGETTFEVLHKCGEPDSKERIERVLGSDGLPVTNSATIENWVYGPKNGMYRFLKFIDGTLVKIESHRM